MRTLLTIFLFFLCVCLNTLIAVDSESSHGSGHSTESDSSLLSFAHPSASSGSVTRESSSSSIGATDSANSSPGRTIAPTTLEQHEDHVKLWKNKGKFHQAISKFLLKTPEHDFGYQHHDEAQSSLRKAEKHKQWYRQIQSGKIQPRTQQRTKVVSSDLPKIPKTNEEIASIMSDRHTKFKRKRGSSYLMPTHSEKKRKRRPLEKDHYKDTY